jgi:hypothetical protein
LLLDEVLESNEGLFIITMSFWEYFVRLDKTEDKDDEGVVIATSFTAVGVEINCEDCGSVGNVVITDDDVEEVDEDEFKISLE